MLFAAVEISLFVAYFGIAINEGAANNQKYLLLFKESRQINVIYLLLFKKITTNTHKLIHVFFISYKQQQIMIFFPYTITTKSNNSIDSVVE